MALGHSELLLSNDLSAEGSKAAVEVTQRVFNVLSVLIHYGSLCIGLVFENPFISFVTLKTHFGGGATSISKSETEIRVGRI